MVMNMGDQAVPNLALEMFRVASSSGAIKTHLDDSGIAAVEVADLTVPTLPNGNIFVHFATHKSMAPRYLSASDVIEGHVDPQMLSGKLVLLGLTGSGLTDMRTNAIGETVPGIEIQAQVIESLFEGRILQRPYWFKWAETLALLIVAGGLIWYVPRPGSLMATYLHRVPKSSLWLMLATNGLIIWIGFEIFIHTGMLFDAASFFLIISAVMGSLVSTVLVGIDNLKKSQEARQESVLQEARVASDRAVLAQLTDGQGRVPTHFGMPQQEES
jgi:CHASE2 domain-containing sensor protein